MKNRSVFHAKYLQNLLFLGYDVDPPLKKRRYLPWKPRFCTTCSRVVVQNLGFHAYLEGVCGHASRVKQIAAFSSNLSGSQPSCKATWDPIWPFFFCFLSYAFDRKKWPYSFLRSFFNNMSKNMGFIRVIYANDRKIMAIRANTAKYGSLTGKKKKKNAIRVRHVLGDQLVFFWF